ncbi:FAD-binding oxidoreductase [Ruegeria marina]|uniref:FAD/FMN-containing dehydrogenase n=1 Tax=Ruegeria marina TaxID=639004 RepID=A0A1G6VWK3_9RHOB|nr:FAD-binding oxidoreductase [Ruegeria marina]SDD58012.1 FAD/FMN-containing dehydrogenase [Ruegeria marina]
MTYDEFTSRLRGTAITAYDPGYSASCDALVWNARKPDRRARVIVRAADVSDVQEAIRYARHHGLGVSARTGGHQFTGIAMKADMVIDLGAFDSLRIDTAAREASIGPAVTNTRLAAALDRHGLAFPVGHCASVPMGGYLLGGGIGWNANAWGIACHSVRSVDVVLADGQIVTASADSHPDLFWAARGAGPSFFGIVTGYRVALQDGPKALTTVVRVYPAARLGEIARWAEGAVAQAPSNVEFTVKIDTGPDGPVIAAIASVFATTEAEAQQTLLKLGHSAPESPIAMMGPMPTPFQALYEITGASTPPGARYGVDCIWSDAAFGDVLARLVQGIGTAPSPRSFGLLALRSNASAVPDISAFSVSGRMMATIYGIWDDEGADNANMAWLRGLSGQLVPSANGAYVGEADLDGAEHRLPILSDAVRLKLDGIRNRYDPENLFRKQPTATGRHAA